MRKRANRRIPLRGFPDIHPNTGTVPGGLPGSGGVGEEAAGDIESAQAATNKSVAAARSSVDRSPNRGKRRKAALRAPAAPPSVFQPYIRPSERPAASGEESGERRRQSARTTRGVVAPMSNAPGRTRTQMARTGPKPRSREPRAPSRNTGSSPESRGKSGSVRIAQREIPASVKA